MTLDEAFLIVKKPARAQEWYLKYVDRDNNFDNLKRLRESLSFLNPIAYRGISRYPLFAFPIADLAELRKSSYYEVDVNTAAKFRMFEFLAIENRESFEDSMMSNLEQAIEVYNLLDEYQREDYEIIKIIKSPLAKEMDSPGYEILGYDIGYWGGDFFSIICDCAINPRWHPPAWDDLSDLAEHLRNLNAHLLFSDINEAVNFREYYKSFSWAETEDSEGEFCIIQVLIRSR